MLRETKISIAALILVSLIFASCGSNQEGVIEVHSSSPKYVDEKYVELEKLYSIDVTQISMFNKKSSQELYKFIDFDENNNLYIMDSFESTIWVFDENGKLARSFGKKGQGPKEFSRPNALIIKKDKIYVSQGFVEYKVVNLEGEYISIHRLPVENWLKFYSFGDVFYIFRAKPDQDFTKLEFILSTYDDQFLNSKDLFRYEYPYGFSGPEYNFSWTDWLFISDNGDFYFPEDNFSKYSIIKYNQDGEPKLKFSRKFQVKEYSKEAKDLFHSIYEKQIKEQGKIFPQSPPVVRKMFQDQKENLWVISGETYEDNENPDFDNTIDLFNKKGEWLVSFQSKLISRYCFYNHGKIYRALPIMPDSFDQFIEVYQIRY